MASTEITSKKKPIKILKSPKGTASKPDTSGSPKSKPKNHCSKGAPLAERLLNRESEAIIRKAIELAKEGDITALKMCVDRILPVSKRRPIAVELQLDGSAESVARAQERLVDALASGKTDPEEARTLKGLLDSVLRSIECNEFERDLSEIKRRVDSL